MLLKVSCHPNACELTCCSLSRCSAADCQHGWGVWWGNPGQVWHLLTATVFTPTAVASSDTCCTTLLCWGPSFTVTLDAAPDKLDHVEIQRVFLPAVEQHCSVCLMALCELWPGFKVMRIPHCPQHFKWVMGCWCLCVGGCNAERQQGFLHPSWSVLNCVSF